MNEDTGYKSHPIGNINQLKALLQDRYAMGFPILKELVQNADDAGATRLNFGWLAGLPKASHPLLQGPGLFFVNNGTFRPQDVSALEYIGISSKADEPTIGKFGLGLKSVFHLCEAFFYLASPSPFEDAPDQLFGQIRNPWAGDTQYLIHNEWDMFSEADMQVIATAWRQFLSEEPWFGLWIPLRRKQQCLKVDPIREDYPGDENSPPEFFNVSGGKVTSRMLASLMPMLHHLKEIQAWLPDATGMRCHFSLQVSEHFNRLRYPNLQKDKEVLFGSVQIVSGDNKERLQLGGVEAQFHISKLGRLKQSRYWPKTMALGVGSYKSVPEKAEQHGAVCFALIPAAESRLDIYKAVFLPVGEAWFTVPGSDRRYTFALFVHGMFFVNPGRTDVEIDKYDQVIEAKDESEVRGHWNYILARQGVCRLVLQALKVFVHGHKLPQGVIYTLTNDLRISGFYQRYQQEICKTHQWVYRLRSDTQDWELLSANTPVYILPNPPERDGQRHKKVFPIFDSLCEQHAFTFSDTPRLSNSITSWPIDLVKKLLAIPVKDVFSDLGCLDYLYEFLSHLDGHVSVLLADHLVELAREAFSLIPMQELRKHRAVVARFIALIPADKRLAVTADESEIFEILNAEVLQAKYSVLILPNVFEPDESSQGLLNPEEVLDILACLSESKEEWEKHGKFEGVRTQIALALLKKTTDAKEMLELCGDLPLFSGMDLKTNRNAGFSLSQLTLLWQKRTLFVYHQSNRKLESALQRALLNDQVVLINAEVVRGLFEKDSPPICDPESCMVTLSQRPQLSTPQDRLELFQELLRHVRDPEDETARAVLRYLLHGQGEGFNSRQFLYICSVMKLGDVWTKLMVQILQTQDASWRIIPEVLSYSIAQQYWHQLDLRPVDIETAVGLLREYEPNSVDGTAFTDDEREILIKEIEDEEILRKLPIHEALSGELVNAVDQALTYLEDIFTLPQELYEQIVVIKKSSNSAIEQKQRSLFSRLNASAVLSLALDQEHPDQYWSLIMDVLSQTALQNFSDTLVDKIKTTAWMPAISGEPFAPENVIYIQNMEDEIAQIINFADGVFSDVTGLIDGIRDHVGYDNLLKSGVLPDFHTAVDMVGETIGGHARYYIGDLSQTGMSYEDFLPLFSDAFKEISSRTIPAFALISGVSKKSKTACIEHLLPYVCKAMDSNKLTNVLSYLTDLHKSKTGDKNPILTLFLCYLSQATLSNSLQHILSEIQLQDANGRWKDCGQLCLQAEGVVNDVLLHPSQVTILEPVLQDRYGELDEGGAEAYGLEEDLTESPYRKQFDEGGKLLEAYFKLWEGKVTDEILGGFLCLLGDEPTIKNTAQKYLSRGRLTVQTTRSRLDWKVKVNRAATHEDIHETMRRQRFFLKVTDEDHVEVQNLLGGRLQAPLKAADKVQNLFLGEESWQAEVLDTGHRIRHIHMRTIDPERFSPRELAALLKGSLAVLLDRTYGREVANLDELWDELSKNERLDIPIAQGLILESGLFYLRQLGNHPNPKIKDILKEFDDARALKVEEELTLGKGYKPSLVSADKDIRLAKEHFKEMVTKDSEVQADIRKAVEKKIKQYQYVPQSVPFELFQNADDAVVEWFDMIASPSDQDKLGSDRFCIVVNKDRIGFAHWGRPINKFSIGDFDGQDRGFHRDLVKMLVLSSSDKEDDVQDRAVTGKFGLGFKSVFLISEAPKVVSDRLQFTVIGGMLPVHLDDLGDIPDRLKALLPDCDRGTYIDLPLADIAPPVEDILKDFEQLASLMLAFSKQIKRIDITGIRNKNFHWTESTCFDIDGLFVGDLTDHAISDSDPVRGLVIRTRYGMILLGLNSEGICSFSNRIPSIWVTAPTREYANLGFLIQSDFDVDVGRGRLAHPSSKNEQLVLDLGYDVGNVLCQIFDAGEKDWQNLCETFRISGNTTPYAFWNTLWTLCTHVKSRQESVHHEAEILAQDLLWGQPQSGIRNLIVERPALPTGLSGKHSILTSIGEVQFTISGCLADHDVFEIVSQWPIFSNKVKPGRAISGSQVAQYLSRLDLSDHIEKMTLQDVISWLAGEDKRITPGNASLIGSLITAEFLKKLESGNSEEKHEHTELILFLPQIKFIGQDGRYHPSKTLLSTLASNADQEEESRRAAFAPEEHILDEAYKDDGLAFFRLCRSGYDAGIEQMVEWALSADERKTQFAVLLYILQGTRRAEFNQDLREHLVGTWLDDIYNNVAFLQLDEYRQQSVLWELRKIGIGQDEQSDTTKPAVYYDAANALMAIAEWWAENKQEYIQKYEYSIYPNAQAPKIEDGFFSTDIAERKAWMLLLMLGVCHTLGRTRFQQHRSFLLQCDQKGWMDKFCDPDRKLESWMQVLESYLDQESEDLEFYMWMTRFTSVFQLARWLSEYPECFLAVNQFEDDFELTHITQPRNSPLFQGGGPDAPSLTRTLGIGANFVMRELVRKGVITNPKAYRHCYLPSQKVRDLLGHLGCQNLDGLGNNRWQRSKMIHGFLSQYLDDDLVTFDLCFDLPLWFVATDADLQIDLLHDHLPEYDYENDDEAVL